MLIDLFVILVVIVLFIGFYLKRRGKENIVPKLESRTPFRIETQNEKSVTISTVIEFRNEGTQSAMIVDAMVKPQLPFEQYDGVEIRGKIERENFPREDDYFEALVIEHLESINLIVKITLTARKNLSIKEAVCHMVDFPIEIIYREVGRTPIHFSIIRIFLTAEELSKLVGVKLVKEWEK